MDQIEIHKIVRANWVLNGDCLNLIGELSSQDIADISNLEKIRVIQPWKFMPSEKTWMELNEHIFPEKPETKLHIWSDTLKSDFIFLSKMSNVKILDLNQVKFKEKETLKGLRQLKDLTLINGNVNELDFLKNLHNLEYLELGRIRGLTNISFVSNLIKLKSLEINNQTQVTKLPEFNKLPELQTVRLITLKNLKDVSNLSQIVNLEGLSFYALNTETEPEQFDFLRNMKKLRQVNSYFNKKDKRQRFELFKNQILNIKST
ncbi:MAG: hypothetical protein HRT69_15205 [Flavobacteriaceae bacterium]|nr:hypothetical protein [Flavobacteriaceae bacterium]